MVYITNELELQVFDLCNRWHTNRVAHKWEIHFFLSRNRLSNVACFIKATEGSTRLYNVYRQHSAVLEFKDEPDVTRQINIHRKPFHTDVPLSAGLKRIDCVGVTYIWRHTKLNWITSVTSCPVLKLRVISCLLSYTNGVNKYGYIPEA